MAYIILCIGETLFATPAHRSIEREKLMCLHFAQHIGEEKKGRKKENKNNER